MDVENEDLTAIDISNGSDDSEEIELTTAQVIEIMMEAWLNEKFAPEILPHKSEVVDCLLGQIMYMEENLSNLSNADFQKSLHQMELDRLRFIVTSYLRTRLDKIEAFVYVTLKEEDQRLEKNEALYLTNDELEFAKAYRQSLDEHFEDFLQFWPGLTPDNWKNENITPNVHSFVFVKSKSMSTIEGIVVDDGYNDAEEDFVDLKSGSQIIISYKSIANLVKDDQVYLI